MHGCPSFSVELGYYGYTSPCYYLCCKAESNKVYICSDVFSLGSCLESNL